jgi:hypothetical protein
VAEHVARVEEMISAYNILVGKTEGKIHSKDLGVDERIILEWILGKWNRDMLAGFF